MNPRRRYFCLFLVAAEACVAACASAPSKPALTSRSPSAAEVQARLADADALAARGCYLCLREASGAYFNLIAISDSPVVARHALENEIMTAMREIELRLPDSGAKERARGLAGRLPATDDYDLYFSMLETPAGVGAGTTLATMRQREPDQKAVSDKLEAAWPSSAVAAYFYIPTALGLLRGDALTQRVSAVRDEHPGNLSVRYRLLNMASQRSGRG